MSSGRSTSRLKRNNHASSEVPEHMTVTPAVVPLLPMVNCDHFNLDHVETLMSLVGDTDGSRALESGGSRMALSISSESCI